MKDIRFQPETRRVYFEKVTAEHVDFSELHFWSFQANRSHFIDCDFSRISVDLLPFAHGGSVFEGCRFERARIGDFGNVRLERCDFTDADLQGWFTSGADILDCRFAGRLERVVFEGSNVKGTRRYKVRDNDFRGAQLHDVSFRYGIDLNEQLLPQSDDYVRLRNLPKRIEHARHEVELWQDAPARAAATRMLGVAARVFSGEPDHFGRRAFIVEMARDDEVGRRVLALLEEAPA